MNVDWNHPYVKIYYINFDISETFNESKDLLSELSKNNSNKFRDYIDSIRKD